jgi:hypothetical protein
VGVDVDDEASMKQDPAIQRGERQGVHKEPTTDSTCGV